MPPDWGLSSARTDSVVAGCSDHPAAYRLFIVSISEKIGPRQYETGFGNYAAFFGEPLYWRTFARTAIMSIAATALTLVLGFPIAYFIAKLTRGRTKPLCF